MATTRRSSPDTT